MPGRIVASVPAFEFPDTIARSSLIAIVDPTDVHVHRELRKELADWYIIACTVDDLAVALRAFQVEFVLIVGGARLVADAFTALEQIDYAPERFAVVPDATQARRAVGTHDASDRAERRWAINFARRDSAARRSGRRSVSSAPQARENARG